MVDKLIKDAVGGIMKKGEQMAPVKSIKLKVKFQKSAKGRALDKLKK